MMNTKFYFLLLFFLCNIFHNIASAQNPTYTLITTCFYCGNSDSNSFGFRIYLSTTNGAYFEYSGGQYSFEVDTSIANGGNLTYEIISSDLPLNVRPRNPSVILEGQKYILFLERNDFPEPGNGYILTGNNVYVATMKVSTTASKINNPEGENMYWRNLNDTVHSTRIFAYVDSVNTDITTPSTHGMDFIFPVNLSYFIANVTKNIVTLNWATSNELNNSGFDIERLIVNSQLSDHWQKISFVEGHGTTNLPRYYTFTDRSLNTGRYSYRLKQIDYNGNFEYYNLETEIFIDIPKEFKISQNYPNPFNPSTKFNYEISKEVNVILKIFNNNGKELMTLVNELKPAGYYEINFSGSNLPSGVYFYQLRARQVESLTDDFVQTRKMVLLR